MRYRPLGRTGQYVSEICLGTMTFSGGAGFWRAIGSLDQASSTKLVSRAIEAGVNFIDTANVYSEGQSEVQLGHALRDLGVKREDVIIATKVRGRMGPGPNAVGLSRGHIMDQIASSLKRLGLDHLACWRRFRPSRVEWIDALSPLAIHTPWDLYRWTARHAVGERPQCAFRPKTRVTSGRLRPSGRRSSRASS